MNRTQSQSALSYTTSVRRPSLNLRTTVWLTVFLATSAMLGVAAGDWQPLFNGSNLAGWKVQCKPEDRSKIYWRVEDGCIVADSMADNRHDYIWLQSEREFGDFELRLKFQAFRDSPGNSGV
ncbi:MAG: DUF1080 domain-containing protein, partial [Verrucomicrobia bacterium]|nr:DUF1080 domain-containing protein [Verrucomicrobiota bacterium]